MSDDDLRLVLDEVDRRRDSIMPGLLLHLYCRDGWLIPKIVDWGWDAIGLEPRKGMSDGADRRTRKRITGRFPRNVAPQEDVILLIGEPVLFLSDTDRLAQYIASTLNPGGWFVASGTPVHLDLALEAQGLVRDDEILHGYMLMQKPKGTNRPQSTDRNIYDVLPPPER